MDENVEAITLFLAADTQWRYSGMGSRTGLDYQGIEVIARIHGLELSSELFGKLQYLERLVIHIDQEKHAEQNRCPSS